MAQDRESTGMAAGLAIGLASAAFLGVGVLMLYLLLRRDQQLGGASPVQISFANPYGLPGAAPAAAPAALPVSIEPTKLLGSGPTMSTTTIPKSKPVWLASAGRTTPVRVTVRPVAPVAGFIVLAYNAGALEGAEVNQQNGFIVPVGQEQVVRLMPKQSLYARAVVPPAESVAYASIIRADAPSDAA